MVGRSSLVDCRYQIADVRLRLPLQSSIWDLQWRKHRPQAVIGHLVLHGPHTRRRYGWWRHHGNHRRRQGRAPVIGLAFLGTFAWRREFILAAVRIAVLLASRLLLPRLRSR